MKLLWSPVARERAAYIDAWWREERPAAEDLFTRELIAAIQDVLEFPEVPAIYRHLNGEPVRRVLLRKTKQHLYYLVRRDEDW